MGVLLIQTDITSVIRELLAVVPHQRSHLHRPLPQAVRVAEYAEEQLLHQGRVLPRVEPQIAVHGIGLEENHRIPRPVVAPVRHHTAIPVLGPLPHQLLAEVQLLARIVLLQTMTGDQMSVTPHFHVRSVTHTKIQHKQITTARFSFR